MERTKRKAINFDLDTNKMKELDLYPSGYGLLGKSFNRQGFEHRQGSGYISKSKLDSISVASIVGKITEEQPWLAQCVKRIDVTDIGRQQDLTAIVKAYELDEVEMLDTNEQEEEEVSEEIKLNFGM